MQRGVRCAKVVSEGPDENDESDAGIMERIIDRVRERRDCERTNQLKELLKKMVSRDMTAEGHGRSEMQEWPMRRRRRQRQGRRVEERTGR